MNLCSSQIRSCPAGISQIRSCPAGISSFCVSSSFVFCSQFRCAGIWWVRERESEREREMELPLIYLKTFNYSAISSLIYQHIYYYQWALSSENIGIPPSVHVMHMHAYLWVCVCVCVCVTACAHPLYLSINLSLHQIPIWSWFADTHPEPLR